MHRPRDVVLARFDQVFWEGSHSSGTKAVMTRKGRSPKTHDVGELGASRLHKECWHLAGSHRWLLFMLGGREGKWCLLAPLFLEGSP